MSKKSQILIENVLSFSGNILHFQGTIDPNLRNEAEKKLTEVSDIYINGS